MPKIDKTMPTLPQILIVEDETVVRRAARLALRAHGWSSDHAVDVESAAPMIRQGAYRVVVTDLKLPGSSGFELLPVAASALPPAQVIVTSGYATIDNSLEAFRLGAFDFLPKPFDVQELISIVDRALQSFDLETRSVSQSPPLREPDAAQYFLGQHSWAQIEPDGSATLGLSPALAGSAGDLAAIQFVTGDERTVQGQYLCTLTSTTNLVHRVWSPLSGRVIATNLELESHPNRVGSEPFAAGWLVRIVPTNLEEELHWLDRRLDAPAG